ncbi:MAG TPA: FAD-dependent oxidoreductase [Alphaproteobacteria bacterium]|nr:FAD-dependent oxidoreductase [Alphaproteobacteria bacterium]
MKIAVIGAGIAGMGAAWLLDQGHEVTVYERNGYVGGHSNTTRSPRGTPVDTGFIVFNDWTYPNLVQLFKRLDVPVIDSDMSFAVCVEGGRYEYSGSSLATLFGQPSNLFRPRHWRMLADLLRFYREAPKLLEASEDPSLTLGMYLSTRGYSDAFLHDHLLPMGAAIWSTEMGRIMDFPAHTFIRFCVNHGLLNVKDRPQWRTVKGGSREYVSRLTAPYRDRIRVGCPAVSVRRDGGGVAVRDAAGHEEHYDHAVLACHGDEALGLMEDADPAEQAVLSAFRYKANRAVLHTDPRLMPKRRAVWASWSYMAYGNDGDRHSVSLTYWMNRLQGIPDSEPLFVSLNPLVEPRPETVIAAYDYDHPLFDTGAILAQKQIGEIQGRNRLWFCGAHLGYGFHEDGLSSGLAVAEALGGIKRPWTIVEKSPAGAHATPRGGDRPGRATLAA